MKEESEEEMGCASQESCSSINSDLEKKTLIMGEPDSDAEFASPGGSDSEPDTRDSQRKGAWMGDAYKALASARQRQDTVVDIANLLDWCKAAKNGQPLPPKCTIFKLVDLWCFGLFVHKVFLGNKWIANLSLRCIKGLRVFIGRV